MRRTPLAILTLLVLAIAGITRAQTAPAAASLAAPIGAGTETGGWVALAYPDTRPVNPNSSEPRLPSNQLYYMPGDRPPGALYGASELPGRPHAIAASGSRVVLLFPPAAQRARGNRGTGATGWTVRALTAFGQPDPLPPVFEPAGRLEILPALQTESDIIGFSGIPGGGVAALCKPISDASGSTIGEHLSLKVLIGGVWLDAELPEPIDAGTPCRILPLSTGLAVLVREPGSVRDTTRWIGEFPATVAPDQTAVTAQWRRDTVRLSGLGSPLIATSGDYLCSAERVSGSVVDLSLHLPDSQTKLAQLAGIPEKFTLVRVADTCALVFLSDEKTPRIMTAVVHTSTGEILHQGPHVRVSPVTTDDLRFLGFVLLLVLMTALVFVLRPSAASVREPVLPPGTAMASPERRLAAGLIDFMIPLVVVVETWGVGMVDVLLAPIRAERPDDFWPFAVTSGAFFVHTVGSEWLFRGRTVGKAILRIRVASINGKRLTFWQCVSRNTIKLVCPPLLVLIFVDPRRRHPGDTMAGAVVVARAKGPLPPIGGSDDEDDDEGPGRTNEVPASGA